MGPITLVLLTCLVPPTIVISIILVWFLRTFVIWAWRSPLKNFPGPEMKMSLGDSVFQDLSNPEKSSTLTNEYVKIYGKNFRFQGIGSFDHRLLPLDSKSAAHVLNNTDLYVKPWTTIRFVSNLIGDGLSTAEGEAHKRARKIISPAFSPQAVRSFAPMFLRKAEELRDKWDSIVDSAGSEAEKGGVEIDLVHWFDRAVFDVIGEAALSYSFDSLNDAKVPVYLAYKAMFAIATNAGQPLKAILEVPMPWLAWLWPDERNRQINASRKTITEFGLNLMQNKRDVLLSENAFESGNTFEDGVAKPKDLLTRLMETNIASNPSDRLSDEEIVNQISTFLFAGSDTTSLALCWCIHLLSKHPDIQTRLRNELLTLPNLGSSLSTDSLTSLDSDTPLRKVSQRDPCAAIDALPYLDHVVKETLRMIPPVHSTIRVPVKDDLIPVSELGGEPVKVAAGTYVHIPIDGFNNADWIWGSDVKKFRPDRWDNLPKAVEAQPGSLPGFMTFSHGPKVCPGARFSMVETKTFIAVLVSQFVFTPSPDDEVYSANVMFSRPYTRGPRRRGTVLPVRVSRYVG